jgi:hypothetical protein
LCTVWRRFFAREVLQQWQQAGYRPHWLVDSNPAKWGGELEGVTIQSPAVLTQLPAGTVVVVAAMQVHGLGERLQAQGLDVWYAERDGSIGRTPGHWLLQHAKRVDKLWNALQESHSRQVLLYTMAARLFQQFHFPCRAIFSSIRLPVLPSTLIIVSGKSVASKSMWIVVRLMATDCQLRSRVGR